jgi:hypothetical protein
MGAAFRDDTARTNLWWEDGSPNATLAHSRQR